jgi:hypothetical protein
MKVIHHDHQHSQQQQQQLCLAEFNHHPIAWQQHQPASSTSSFWGGQQ